MPTIDFSGAINAADWQFVTALQGRTVIQPTYDVHKRAPRDFYGTEESANLDIPQIMYCENAVPAAEGMNSVGYLNVIPASAYTDFDQCIVLRDANENNYLFAPANGKNYILNPTTQVWASTNPIASLAHPQVTRAYVNGRTFICYAGKNVYEYAGGTFLPVGLTLPAGVAVTDIHGIGASSNYLLLFTEITVYWSSLVDPLDFTPSVTTGAGYATPQDVRGRITAVQAAAGGFVIWTTRNAVAAQYTNNVRAPFSFKEIANAGGITEVERVTQDAASGAQFAWTTGGLQRVTLQSAETLSGQINDFLAGRVYSTWNTTTKNIDKVLSSTAEFYTKLSLIASRYLCISYSDTINANTDKAFQYCLVYDVVLKRWGQFKIDHVDVFPISVSSAGSAQTFTDLGTSTFNTLGSSTFNDLVNAGTVAFDPTSKRQIAFLQVDGAVKIALMDYNKNYNHAGVVVFGKYQLTHSKIMQHQRTLVEGADGQGMSGSDTFQAYLLPSLDGMNLEDGETLTKVYENKQAVTYGKRRTGVNFAVALTGTFSLSSLLFMVTQEGDC